MYGEHSWDAAKAMNNQNATHLSSLIDALEYRLNSLEPANRSLVSLLSSLAAHLEMHFELEKPERELAVAAIRSARLNTEIRRLQAEREAIHADVEEMVSMARLAFIHKQPTEPLAKRYHAFVERFAQHEAAEKKLLLEVLDADPSMAE